jgi:plasmid stabilization system protein ParE
MTDDTMVILRRAVREENWELAALAALVTIAETIRDSGPEAAEALVDELAAEIMAPSPHPHRRRRGRRDRR